MAKGDVAVRENEVEKFDKTAYVPVEFNDAYGMDFDELAEEAISLPGHDLVKDDELDSLVGIDFIITKINFRAGLKRRDDNKWVMENPTHEFGAYVSLELSTNPTLVISNVNRARVASDLPEIQSLSHLGFDLGANFVINDGSTGIYRQIVAFLAMTGYIELPEGLHEGKSGQTICDTIPEEWTEVHVGDVRFDPSGFQTYTANVRLRCRRGLRVSKYESEWNPDSKTRYLAV